MTIAIVAPAAAEAAGVRSLVTSSCPNPPAYPPSPGATVQVSSSAPSVGDSMTVTGLRYCGNEDVTIAIDGTPVGTGHTNRSGQFVYRFVVDPPAGTQSVCGLGASGLRDDRQCTSIAVQGFGVAAAAAGPAQSSSSSGTAVTVIRVAELSGLALLLLGPGIGVAFAGRRRKSASQV